MDEDFMMGEVGPDDEAEDRHLKVVTIPEARTEAVQEQVKFSASLPNRRVRTFSEVYKSESNLKFIIPDVLPESGLIFFGGLSGTGKTILAIQVVRNIVMGLPTMTWKLSEDLPQMVGLIFSLEMSGDELQRRMHDMYPSMTEEEDKILQENLFVYSEPEPFELWNYAHCVDMIQIIGRTKANVILIDSASVSFAQSLKDDVQVNQSLKNLYSIRVRMNVAIIIVAHTRKPSQGISSSPEEASINELFGHSGIAQWASSIFLLIEDEKSRKDVIKAGNGDEAEKVVHVINVKTRFGSSNAAFKTKLASRKATLEGTPLQFRRDAIELQPITPEQRRKIREKKSDIAASFEGIDFSAFRGEEDDV